MPDPGFAGLVCLKYSINTIMLYISYRGIFDGTNFQDANTPVQIAKAFNKGCSVMVDAWKVGDNFYLGNDEPITQVTSQYLQGNRFWINARNSDMYAYLLTQPSKLYPHYFQVPDPQPQSVTVSDGRSWVFGTVATDNNCVVALPEVTDMGLLSTLRLYNYGVCSSYLQFIKRIRNEGAPFYGDINIPF